MEIPKSFDIIGDIIIIEIPEELEGKEKNIVLSLRKKHPYVKTICKKIGKRKTRKRLYNLEIIFGKNTETIHTEHGCKFKLDVKKVYFSERESTERQRIAEKIKAGEKVLVMFSGIGPYAIVSAKKQDAKFTCVEINEDAVKYAEENVRVNKVQEKVKNICGDVREVCPKLGKFDRILGPLPEKAYTYLEVMFKCCKKNGIIHLYGISEEKNLFINLEKEIKKAARSAHKKIKITARRKVLPYAPRTWKVCVEFKVL